uniref:Nicotinamide N-methyltransferase n=1 Tax=Sphenodon punctatus TaxID=8508 RepID=A0A8D0GL68_SPHPU
MDSDFTEKDTYEQRFVPKDYLEMYYSFGPRSCVDNDLLVFRLKILHKAFILDGINGDTLIDIGSGPTIYQLLSACESFKEIIATDYTEQACQELHKWLKNEPGAFDWSPVVKRVCELEGDREKSADKEEKLRKTVKRVLKCDVTQPNPLAPESLPQADCLLSTLCLEAACKDLATYHSAIKNITSLLKPGGHLVLLAVLEETYYMIGQCQFSCLYLEQEMIVEAVREAGYEVKCVEVILNQHSRTVTDAKGVCAVIAQKHREK